MKRQMHAVLRLSFANAKGIFADDGETRPHQARWRAWFVAAVVEL